VQTRKSQSVDIFNVMRQFYERVELWKISIQSINKSLFHCIIHGISSISAAYPKEDTIIINDHWKKVKKRLIKPYYLN